MERITIATVEQPDGVHIISLGGKLDVFSFAEVSHYFEAHCAKASGAKVVVDLSGVSYIASSGWSTMLSRRRILRLSGGDLVICGLSGECQRVYDSMKINTLLPSCAGLLEAKAKLAAAVP